MDSGHAARTYLQVSTEPYVPCSYIPCVKSIDDGFDL